MWVCHFHTTDGQTDDWNGEFAQQVISLMLNSTSVVSWIPNAQFLMHNYRDKKKKKSEQFNTF